MSARNTTRRIRLKCFCEFGARVAFGAGVSGAGEMDFFTFALTSSGAVFPSLSSRVLSEVIKHAFHIKKVGSRRRGGRREDKNSDDDCELQGL